MAALRQVVIARSSRWVCCARTMASESFNFQTFEAKNEPVLQYVPGSKDAEALQAALDKYSNQTVDVPICVGDEEIRTDEVRYQVAPFDHQKKIAKFYNTTSDVLKKAIDVSLKARVAWEQRPQAERAEIFYKAAELMSKKYRMDMMATTMLGQAKNIVQAEIDAAAELIDFLRFNIQNARDMTKYQPISPSAVETNKSVYRGIEGFWAAVTPFNFTAIGGHLPSAPALMGNVCLWKPASTAVLSNYTAYKIYREAGLPPGVINFVPSTGSVFGNTITASPHFAGLNFTGSVETFNYIWKHVAQHLEVYKTYPRLIGECGGKNFHFIHPSADIATVVAGTVRSAFEYSGQKCSACSRMYVPQSLWPKIKDSMLDVIKQIHVGSPLDKETFVSAVIDDKSFATIKGYIDHAKSSPDLKIVAGGTCDDSIGYFIDPTIIETTNPKEMIMEEEIFGPVLTVYVYPDKDMKDAAKLASETSPYALTGAIFAQDRNAVEELTRVFRDSIGNFYINTKCTGSVVGQQPFGGARLSGTNDKAGGPHYVMRFVSPLSIKEVTVPQTEWRYPSMG